MHRVEIWDTLDSGWNREEWNELCADDPLATVFQSSEWLQAYKETSYFFSRWIVLRRDRQPTCGVAIVRSHFTLGFAGGSFADVRGPVMRRGAEQDLELLYEWLISSRIAPVDFREVVAERGPKGAVALPESVRWQIDLPITFEEYLSTLGKSLRADVKRAARPDGLVVKKLTGPDRLEGFEQLVRLHQARWKQRWMPGSFRGRALKFHRRFLQLATEEQVSIWRALDAETQKPVGYLYALHHGDTASYYQAGIDPQLTKCSPGTALVAAVIKDAISRGDKKFDLLRGEEPYKLRWKPQRRVVNQRYLFEGDGWINQGSLAMRRKLALWERGVKSILEQRR